MKTYTVAQIAAINKRSGGKFFSRDCMRLYGDTLGSFGVYQNSSFTVLYRKPTATVRIQGERIPAGRDYFAAWHFKEDDGSLTRISTLEKEYLWQAIQ